jgi:hypothetical protein
MQESITAPPTKEDLRESASALLEAIVRAEVELHALHERCSSLELAISLGREAVATAESLPAESAPAKSTSGKRVQESSPASEEISPAPKPRVAPAPTLTMAPIKPPKPLSIPKPQPTKAAEKVREKPLGKAPEPVLEPVAAATAPETPESRAAASASLEEQAAALRAAMGETSASAAKAPAANADPRPSRGEPTKTEAPPVAKAPGPVDHEPRPFKPKRSTPLKSRLAGLDVKAAETESESYSERSAELEQLLRSRDED